MASIHDGEGYFVDVDGDSVQVTGFDRSALLASNPYNDFHPDDIPLISAHHVALLSGAREDTWLRYRRRAPDESFHWIETTSRLMEIEGAAIIACLTRRCEDQTHAHVVDERGIEIDES